MIYGVYQICFCCSGAQTCCLGEFQEFPKAAGLNPMAAGVPGHLAVGPSWLQVRLLPHPAACAAQSRVFFVYVGPVLLLIAMIVLEIVSVGSSTVHRRPPLTKFTCGIVPCSRFFAKLSVFRVSYISEKRKSDMFHYAANKHDIPFYV